MLEHVMTWDVRRALCPCDAEMKCPVSAQVRLLTAEK